MKKRQLKVLVAALLAVVLVLGPAAQALACTGFYMGSGTTDDGSTLYGRNEDISATKGKLHIVVPAAEHDPGDMFVSNDGFTYPYPASTYRYEVTPDMYNNYGETNTDNANYGAAGMNEKGVAVTATVTLNSNRSVTGGTTRTWDPMASSGGLTELNIPSMVLMKAATAREGVEFLAEIVDNVGSAERNGVTISDANETWYMEFYTGHQYLAVKAPANQIGFSPNIGMIGAVDVTDTANVVASPDLVSYAQAHNFLVTDANGNLKAAETYMAATNGTSINGRMYLGYYYLLGAAAASQLATQTWYPYFIDPRPAKNYSLYEAMRLLSYHGNKDDVAAGKYVENPTSNSTAIGMAANLDAHIFQIRPGYPDELATVQWLTQSPSEFALYLPSYGALITDTYEAYQVGDTTYNNRDLANFSWLWREVYITICSSQALGWTNHKRAVLEEAVSGLLESYQKKLIAAQADIDTQMKKVYAADPELASVKATELYSEISKQAYEYGELLLEEMQDWLATNPGAVFIPSPELVLAAPDYSFAAVDSAGPETVIKVTPISKDDVSVTFTADDGVAGSGVDKIYYEFTKTPVRADGVKAFAALNTTYTYNGAFTVGKGAGLPAGDYTLKYWAVDKADNAGKPLEYDFTVLADEPAPTTPTNTTPTTPAGTANAPTPTKTSNLADTGETTVMPVVLFSIAIATALAGSYFLLKRKEQVAKL
ncbi:MAG: C69 family dipeptidase [Actinomycetes bacterium]|jgi:dipeptidase|nr:C69 family dipeptidase [Actinomycetes bacterium]